MTAIDYRLKIRNSAGIVVGEYGRHIGAPAGHEGLHWLAYQKSTRGAGFLRVQISGDTPFLDEMDADSQLDVDLSFDGGAWQNDFIGLWAGDIERTWVDGVPAILLQCYGSRDLLARSVIAYRAGTVDRTNFTATAAETVAKTLFTYNATAAATVADGRLLDFQPPVSFTLAVEADAGRGNVVDWFCAWQNLLESLADLSRVGGGDFDLVRSAVDPTLFTFHWYDLLGTDRTDSIVFALRRDNLVNPRVRFNVLGAASAVVVGGDGQQAARNVSVAYAPNYSAVLHREVFLDAWDTTTDAGRIARGQRRLNELRPREDFTWEALQTEATRYARDYFLGDLVTVVRPDTEENTVQKVTGVTVGLQTDGTESVHITTEAQ